MAAYSALHMLCYGHTSIIKRNEQELIEQLSPPQLPDSSQHNQSKPYQSTD